MEKSIKRKRCVDGARAAVSRAERIVKRWQADAVGEVADRLAALRQAMADAAPQHDVTQCQSGAKLGADAR